MDTGRADGGDEARYRRELPLREGMVVQEVGWSRDVDDAFRDIVVDVIGGGLVDEGYGGDVDAVLLWWRAGEGVLADALLAAGAVLSEGRFVLLLTPKVGGYVRPEDIDEAVVLTGFHRASAIELRHWHGVLLTKPSRSR